MARIRSVHPGLFTDEAFVQLSDGAQIMWIGLWTEADDQGVFEWKPLMLKMRLRPASTEAVDHLLEELVAADCIAKFDVNGRHYGAVRNFCRYQRPRKPNSVHPLPDELRNYVGLSDRSYPPRDDEGGGSSPPTNAQAPPVPKRSELVRVVASPSSPPSQLEAASVPQKSEIAPQMEDGGKEGEEEGRKKGSELRSAADGGAKPPPDVRLELWAEGLTIIRGVTGKSDQQSRALLGKLLKTAKDDCAVVLGALRRAADLRPVDPIPWITGAVKPRLATGRAFLEAIGEDALSDALPLETIGISHVH